MLRDKLLARLAEMGDVPDYQPYRPRHSEAPPDHSRPRNIVGCLTATTAVAGRSAPRACVLLRGATPRRQGDDDQSLVVSLRALRQKIRARSTGCGSVIYSDCPPGSGGWPLRSMPSIPTISPARIGGFANPSVYVHQYIAPLYEHGVGSGVVDVPEATPPPFLPGPAVPRCRRLAPAAEDCAPR